MTLQKDCCRSFKKIMVNDKVYASKFSQVWTKVLMRLVTAYRLGNSKQVYLVHFAIFLYKNKYLPYNYFFRISFRTTLFFSNHCMKFFLTAITISFTLRKQCCVDIPPINPKKLFHKTPIPKLPPNIPKYQITTRYPITTNVCTS